MLATHKTFHVFAHPSSSAHRRRAMWMFSRRAGTRQSGEVQRPQRSPQEAHGVGTARPLGEQHQGVSPGGKNWFFLVADYAFGHLLFNGTSAVVKQYGGKVLGSVKHPPSSPDVSSYILQAQTSGEQILGLATTSHHRSG